MEAREVVALLRVVCALGLARPAAGDAWWRTQRIPGLWLLVTPYVAAWEPAVLAHYLPWYTTGASATETASERTRRGWCDASLQNAECATDRQYAGAPPFIGEYDQRDNATLVYHALLASAVGIDSLVVNLNPVSTLQREICRSMITVLGMLRSRHGADNFGLRLALSYDNSQATTPEAAAADFAVVSALVQEATAAGVYFTNSSAPVVFLWSEAPVAYAALRAALPNSTLVLARNANNFGPSDGNFAWLLPINGANASLLASMSPDMAMGMQYLRDVEWGMANSQGSLAAAERNLLLVGSAYPGFDDTHVPVSWNGGVSRRLAYNTSSGGATYDATWQHALSYVPMRYGGSVAASMPWVQIVTWNDFPEGTAIEPRQQSTESSEGEEASSPPGGHAAYAGTREWVRRWKGRAIHQQSDEPVVRAIEAAAALYEHRRRGLDAAVAEALFLSGAYGAAAAAAVAALPAAAAAAAAAQVTVEAGGTIRIGQGGELRIGSKTKSE